MDAIDTTDQIRAVDRVVATGSRDGTETKSVVLTQTYPVSLEDLWDACTTAERISRWLMPISGDLRVGGRYQLHGNAGGVVEECVPRERVAMTWEFNDQVTWVVATFAEAADGARVRVEHIAAIDEQLWEQYGPGAVGIGWDMMLLGLSLHLTTGVHLDEAQALEWQTSPEGIDFMKRSVDSWCEAQVASGDDRAAASAAAERILTAYSGG